MIMNLFNNFKTKWRPREEITELGSKSDTLGEK